MKFKIFSTLGIIGSYALIFLLDKKLNEKDKSQKYLDNDIDSYLEDCDLESFFTSEY